MGFFDDDDDSGDKCPYYDLYEVAKTNFIAGMKFKQFNQILAGACTALACVIAFIHLFRHATHLSVPRQQIKVMRVISLVPLYAITNILCIAFPPAAVYILPVLDVLSSFCLASYFMLLCEYISPHSEGQDAFFSRIEIEDKKAPEGKVQDNVKWFKQRTFMIMQYPVVALAIFIATAVTQALKIYCQFDSKTNYAKLYLSIVQAITSGLGIASVILVAVNVKKQMPNLKPIHKLVAIKLVVGLAFLQQILFWILQSVKALKPTDKLTYGDLHIGIPSLLSCVEMVPISLVIMWAYPVGPYHLKSSNARRAERGEEHEYTPTSYQGGPLGIHAFLSLLNPSDVIKAIFVAFGHAISQGTSQLSDKVNQGSSRFNSSDNNQYNGGYSQQQPQYQQQQQYQQPQPAYGQGRPQYNQYQQQRPQQGRQQYTNYGNRADTRSHRNHHGYSRADSRSREGHYNQSYEMGRR